MTPKDFTYWLNGFLAANPDKSLSYWQTKEIIEKLNTVFTKVTPTVATLIEDGVPATTLNGTILKNIPPLTFPFGNIISC